MIVPGIAKDQLAAFVVNDWDRMKNERRAKEEIWRECWLAYNSKFGKSWAEVAQFRSRRYLPASFEAVENVSSHLMQGVIPHEDWFTVEGRTPDDDDMARVQVPLMKWQHYKTNFSTEFCNVLRAAAVFGNCPWTMAWTEDVKYTPDVEAHAENLGRLAYQKESGEVDENAVAPAPPQRQIKEYDGPKLKCGNIFDYCEDRYPRGAAYAARIMRTFLSKEHLKEMAKPNQFGVALYENVEGLNNQTTELDASDSMKRQVDAQMGFTDNPKEAVELLERWGDFVVEDATGEKKLYKNHVAVVANRTTLIRFEPNPNAHGLPPHHMFVLNPEPGETYGKGVLESALGIQDAINVRMNQVIEANALIVNPQWVVKNDGTIDIDSFISAPGALHLVNDINGTIAPLAMPSNAALGFQEIGFLLGQFNEATNAMKAFTTADYQKSATEVAAMAGVSNSRFAQTVKHIENTFVMLALRMQIQLNQQFMDEATWIRVVNPTNVPPAIDDFGQPKPVPMWDFVDANGRMKVTPDQIQGEFDIFPMGAQWISNNQAAMGALMQSLQVLGSVPQAAESIKWGNLSQFIFQMARIPHSYKLIKSQQEVAFDRFQQQQQQLAFAAQQQALGLGPQGPGEPKDQPGGKGVGDMAGTPSGPSLPTSPGGQSTAGGPQTMG